VDIRDFENNLPIHDATKFTKLRKNTLPILKLLIQFGADINAPIMKVSGTDSIYHYVPIMGAPQRFDCAAFLLDHGANTYFQSDNDFVVWNAILSDDLDDGIFVAKYMIIDKKMKVPNPIAYSIPNRKPLDSYSFLNQENFRRDYHKEDAKNEIIKYLKQINFPENAAYIR